MLHFKIFTVQDHQALPPCSQDGLPTDSKYIFIIIIISLFLIIFQKLQPLQFEKCFLLHCDLDLNLISGSKPPGNGITFANQNRCGRGKN